MRSALLTTASKNVVPNVLNFLGAGRHTATGSAVQANASAEPAVPEIVEPSPAVPLLNENFDEVSPVVPEAAAVPTSVQPAAARRRVRNRNRSNRKGGLGRLLSSLTGKSAEPAAQPLV